MNQKQQDALFKLIDESSTNSQIRNLLRPTKETDKDVRISGPAESLLDNLRAAFNRGTVTLKELQALLARSEESGRQHIFFYKPRPQVVAQYRDAERVARSLFGAQWARSSGFPRFELEPRDMTWADFRIQPATRTEHPEWTGKLYVGREHESFLDQHEEQEDGYVVVTRRSRRESIRSVLLARWRSWGLLELRVPTGDADGKTNVRKERDDLWEALEPAVKREHFIEWKLDKALAAFVKKAQTGRGNVRLGQTIAKAGDASAKFSPASETESLFACQQHRESVAKYPSLAESAIYFKKDDNHFERDLLVQVGAVDSWGIRIGSKASPEALDYVIFRLREAANES